MSDEQNRAAGHEGVASWDKNWAEQLGAEPLDFASPSLENHIDERKLAFLAADLPQAGRALEVGAGSARLLARVGMAAPLELVAVDNAANALQLSTATAARFGLSIEGVKADAHALPFETGSFDVVLSGGLLEHFENPGPVLAEMVRVLRPGALFYADVVPRKLSLYRLRELVRMVRSPYLMPGVYESSLGPRYYRNVLGELGCRSIRIESAGVYPHRHTLAWAKRTARLDGGLMADALGWYFMISARKA
jgi:SAM-dependent methyltransferase